MAYEQSDGSLPNPELDITKLQSLPPEQQELYILTFTSDLARHVSSLDADGASAHQIYLRKELFQIISLPSPPTRVIRNNIGKCFAGIFRKGDRKLLFDSINELLGIVNSGKSEKDLRMKHAAVYCLGEIFGAAGDSATSLLSATCASLLKLLKPAQIHAGLRSSVFKALGKLFEMVGGSVDEPVARDVWKQARSVASSDKAAVVQMSALKCLENLTRETTCFDNTSDFDSLKNTLIKSLDSTAPPVRHAAASCLASTLVKLFSEDASREAPVRAKRPKKANRRQSMAPGDDEEVQRPGSPVARKPAMQLSFNLSDLLRQLSAQYVRTSTTNRVRAGIAVCYTRVLKSLADDVVETQYSKITDHLLIDLLSHPNLIINRYRVLTTRKFVRVILEDVVGRQILGETGQLSAAKVLVNDVLKNYPQAIKERPEPSKHTLNGALSALSSLVSSLGSVANGIADSTRDGLLQVLQHPSYTVQVSTSHCLRAFVLACPQQLLPCVSICMNSVSRELNLLKTPRHSPRRCVGYANGLAAILSTAPLQPLYGSVDVNSRVLSLATGLLKSSGNHELRVSGTEIQVAWILIGGLMSLGPNFVKIHLSQLLLLWKNALPKPLAKDSMVQRSALELSFLTHVRECALGSILAFLEFNSRLLTTDVSKRIAAMLQNTTLFLNILPSKKVTEDVSQRLSPSLQLQDLDLMVRRRVLQCYVKLVNLSPSGGSEILMQSNLLTLAVSFFADPDNYSPSSLSTSIASSAGTFETVWDVGDNCGFGITGLVRGLEIKRLPGEHVGGAQSHWHVRGGPDNEIDQTLMSPICGAREHDSVSLYISSIGETQDLPEPPATEVINSAIHLFAISLPLQAPKVQESILEQIATFLAANSLQRDPGRKAAMTVNIALALLATLKVSVKETLSAPGDLRSPPVERIMQEMLRRFVVHPDQYVRNIAYEALGRLCSSSGNTFTANEINYLVDMIVTNRDPNARAGCAVALGCIHSQVGGMAAGYHLKTIHGILMSLVADPHPIVHFWALEALSKVMDSAGLTYSGYVSSTLGMLAQLYVTDTHDEEVASVATSNLELELSTTAAIAWCIDSLVNVLGPDLQDMSKARDLIFTLVRQFQAEGDFLVLIESLRCLEHLSLYAAGHMEYAAYIRRLQSDLSSSKPELRDVAIDGLYNLMKRDANDVIKTADAGLDDQLWFVLDAMPNHEGIQNLIKNWLTQTGLSDTVAWVQRCQSVLTKTKLRQAKPPASVPKANAVDLQDEEVAGFAASAESNKDESSTTPSSGQELLKWQVRMFAMSCLSDLLTIAGKAVLPGAETPAETALAKCMADVVQMAFSASTSNVVELRVWGLRIIDQVLKIFGKVPDPDFAESPLLEQYQAQISSALTPAFAADSSPELASEAVNVCAVFIATGIVTDVDRMGRILKLLVSALENFSSTPIAHPQGSATLTWLGDSETASIGDLKGLSSNAQVMVKMAVFSAWAELQIASTEQKYLVDVVKPHIATLTPLWLSSLREFARLRFEPDISMNSGPASLSGSLDTIYSALNRETLLKFYQDSWLNLVDAIASLIEQDSGFVFDALDDKTKAAATNGDSKGHDINYRDEPVAFFFVLFGIAFEALVGRPGSDSLATRDQTLEILLALKKILQPQVSGHAIYQEVVFSETMDLFDRLALTEGLDVQLAVVEIARNLCISHPSSRDGQDNAAGGENFSEDIDQLFELTRIIVLVLAGLLPNLTRANAKAILGTSACQEDIIPQSLPIFKRFIQGITRTAKKGQEGPATVATQIRGCLKQFLAILANAQKRETESSLPCVKNTLLASTILVTSSTNVLPPTDPLVTKLLDEIVDCLSDRMTSAVASNCSRSLLLTHPKSPCDQEIARYLIPHLITFTTTNTEDPENARALVSHALTSFTSILTPIQIPTYLSLILPTLLSRASVNKDPLVFRETSTRLLELAAFDQGAFRSIVAQLSPSQRAFIEEVIRSGAKGGSSAGEIRQESNKPSIALRMDFGSTDRG